MKRFYIYIYYDPRDNCPFYVGKGCGRRYLTNKRNKSFNNLISELEKSGLKPLIIILKKNLTEKRAFSLEEKLIKYYGRKDLNRGNLCNLTNGGEGESGHIHSEEHKRKIGLAGLGRIHSEEAKRKIGKGNAIALLGKKLSEEHKKKLSISHSGPKHHMYGKKHKVLSIEKMKISANNRWKNIKEIKKVKKRMSKLWKTPSYREKQIEAHKNPKNWNRPRNIKGQFSKE